MINIFILSASSMHNLHVKGKQELKNCNILNIKDVLLDCQAEKCPPAHEKHVTLFVNMPNYGEIPTRT